MAVEDVDLQLAQPDRRGEGDLRAVAAPHHRQDAGHEFLGREGHGEQVIHAAVKRGQRGFEVAPPRESDQGDAHVARCGVPEPIEHVPVREVHVDDDEMGGPLRQRGERLLSRCGHVCVEAAVVERELDDLGEHGLIDHQQHPRGVAPVVVGAREARDRARLAHCRRPFPVSSHASHSRACKHTARALHWQPVHRDEESSCRGRAWLLR